MREKSLRLALLEDRRERDEPLPPDRGARARGHDGPVAASLRNVQGPLSTAKAEKLGLSSQDMRMVELLAEVCSNREIRDHLHLSANTVKDQEARSCGFWACAAGAEVYGRAALERADRARAVIGGGGRLTPPTAPGLRPRAARGGSTRAPRA